MKRRLDWTVHVDEYGCLMNPGWPPGFDPDRRKWARETAPAGHRLTETISRLREPRDS